MSGKTRKSVFHPTLRPGCRQWGDLEADQPRTTPRQTLEYSKISLVVVDLSPLIRAFVGVNPNEVTAVECQG